MSALAGIFRFDPRDRVDMSDLMDLAHRIDRIGPDGGGEYLTGNIGMAYRAFHTTPESHFEVQPLVRESCVLTWDGRLDNRDEIRTRVSRRYEGTRTDLDLAFAAYQEWGTGCFAELIGDWAFALWDDKKQQLVLARDYIGVRRLFYRIDEGGVAWSTTIEPLVLTSGKKLHLDLDYLAGCLYPRPPVETTAYREIRSVIPAAFLTFGLGGKQESRQYWSLNPNARIRYSTDREYEKHFREVFRESVSRRLQADRTILAELSGGIDSSSIVCMADDICARQPGPAIETLSYYDTDEPSGDERPYFKLIEEKRGYAGHHISTSELTQGIDEETLAPLPEGHFSASPSRFSDTLHWDSLIESIQTGAKARTILSGLGGDEILGGIQYESPEIVDYLLAGRLASFVRSSLAWSRAKGKTVFGVLGDAVQLMRASRDPEFLRARLEQQFSWAFLKPVSRHAALAAFALWRRLPPAMSAMEWARYNLASQLTSIDPPLVGHADKRYPYLDRSLFVFLASIPRTQILQVGHRRHLMRRALRDLVPDAVLFRKTKWFGSRRIIAVLQDQAAANTPLFQEKWLSDRVLFDATLVHKCLEEMQHGASNEGLPLMRAIAIEQWLRSQIEAGCVELPHRPILSASPDHRLAMCF